jgi:hypothetical protein
VPRYRWLVAAALSLVLAVAVPQAASATTRYPLDPAHDIAAPAAAFGSACWNHPYGDTCQTTMIRALNRARAVLGEPAYALPTRFKSLHGVEQLLVLSNLDRRLYGRAAITGFNADLMASARYGAASDSDPPFVPVGGTSPSFCGSNWVGPLRSPLVAYYMWMYADAGQGWAHRHNTLMRIDAPDNRLAMGVAHGTDASGRPAWTELYEAFPSKTAVPLVPTVVLLSSRSGPETGGTDIAILGFGFRRVVGVSFGTTPARFSVDSLNIIHVLTPAHSAGRVTVRVSTSAGTSSTTAAAAFLYG